MLDVVLSVLCMLAHLIQQSCKVNAMSSPLLEMTPPVGKVWSRYLGYLAEIIHVVNDGARVWTQAV